MQTFGYWLSGPRVKHPSDLAVLDSTPRVPQKNETAIKCFLVFIGCITMITSRYNLQDKKCSLKFIISPVDPRNQLRFILHTNHKRLKDLCFKT